MDKNTFRKINLLLFFLMLGLLIYSLISGNVFVAFTSTLLYMMLISLIKIRIRGVLIDERQIQISGKASGLSFRVLLPILILTSISLLIGGGDERFHYLRALGIIIAYITILAILIYSITYWCFDKKTRE